MLYILAIAKAAEEYNIDDFFPNRVMSDFEMSIINPILDNFPLSLISLYYFHLKKRLYREIQLVGLALAYNDINDRDLKMFYIV